MNASLSQLRRGLEFQGLARVSFEDVLTPPALDFLTRLTREFAPRLGDLLRARGERRAAGPGALGFLLETAALRSGDWRVAPLPPDLQKRQVEITGPVDAKMILNALNSGADVFMADFEDATAPTWRNMVLGQRHLRDAVRGTLTYDDAVTGKRYRLNERPATLMIRPRGLHLPEDHLWLDGRAMPGAFFDFGLAAFHNARTLLERGSGPYFYLPKLEHHLEARLWNDIFEQTETMLGIPRGSIRATVLIETLPAAFQMDEILYELRERSAGLNCGRWDYIFSFIKTFRDDPNALLPDRSQIGMDQPFLRAYTQLAVKTCHRRGVHAMGGMAAQIPSRQDPEANARALEQVRRDKEREVGDGHDGTWVAHPGLVPIARDAFLRLAGPHQLHVLREDVQVTEADLLRVPQGTRTENGLRWNVRVGIQYLEAWLRGQGCVPLYHLMEDAATAEISRTQVWQWIRHGAALEGGERVTSQLAARVVRSEMQDLARELGADRMAGGRFAEAEELFTLVALGSELEEFLTLPAYRRLNAIHDPRPSTDPS